MGKIEASDKIMCENQKKREKWKYKKCLHKSPYRKSFRHRPIIHILLRRADARGSTDIFYRFWRISL